MLLRLSSAHASSSRRAWSRARRTPAARPSGGIRRRRSRTAGWRCRYLKQVRTTRSKRVPDPATGRLQQRRASCPGREGRPVQVARDAALRGEHDAPPRGGRTAGCFASYAYLKPTASASWRMFSSVPVRKCQGSVSGSPMACRWPRCRSRLCAGVSFGSMLTVMRLVVLAQLQPQLAHGAHLLVDDEVTEHGALVIHERQQHRLVRRSRSPSAPRCPPSSVKRASSGTCSPRCSSTSTPAHLRGVSDSRVDDAGIERASRARPGSPALPREQARPGDHGCGAREAASKRCARRRGSSGRGLRLRGRVRQACGRARSGACLGRRRRGGRLARR